MWSLPRCTPRACGSARPFISVNMGGLSETLFESELFGHVRGAFTDAKSDRVGRFEMAEGGPCFSTRLPTSRPGSSPSCCGSSRVGRTNGWARPARSRRTSGWWWPPMRTCARRWRRDVSARISCSGSTRLRSISRRCGTAARILSRWPLFFQQQRTRYRKDITGFEPAALQACRRIPGRETSGNSHAVERAVLGNGPLVRAVDLGLGGVREAAPRLEDMNLEEVERFFDQADPGALRRQRHEGCGNPWD